MASKRKDIDTPETELVSKRHKRNSQTPIQVDDSKLPQDTVLQTPIQDEDRKVLGPPKKSPPTVNVPSLPVIHQNVPITNNAGAGVAASPSDGAPRVMNAKCEALFDFDGQDNDDLPFKKGDILIITGELDGWYLGKTLDGARTGIFPSNYVKVK